MANWGRMGVDKTFSNTSFTASYKKIKFQVSEIHSKKKKIIQNTERLYDSLQRGRGWERVPKRASVKR